MLGGIQTSMDYLVQPMHNKLAQTIAFRPGTYRKILFRWYSMGYDIYFMDR